MLAVAVGFELVNGTSLTSEYACFARLFQCFLIIGDLVRSGHFRTVCGQNVGTAYCGTPRQAWNGCMARGRQPEGSPARNGTRKCRLSLNPPVGWRVGRCADVGCGLVRGQGRAFASPCSGENGSSDRIMDGKRQHDQGLFSTDHLAARTIQTDVHASSRVLETSYSRE